MAKQLPKNICSKPFDKKGLLKIREIIKNNPQANRQKLSRVICDEFGWRSENGKLKEMSCRVAMLKLYRAGMIELPKPQKESNNGKKLKVTSISDPCFQIEKAVTELKDIGVKIVESRKESKYWNELIERYHYLGYTPLAGAQIRYIINCAEGLLGVIGFSAAAWKTAPRDKWIGWNAEQRERNLRFIVNNARFLIVPWVRVPHLASKILSLCARRLRNDWKQRYGYEPVLLETFVEKDKFKGTCYKAANWIKVGQTQGRGKKDIHNLYALPIKDIWLYPLEKDFRQRLINGM